MALAWSGYFSIDGSSVQYEYRHAIMNRSEATVQLRLELRLKPVADLAVGVMHAVRVYGGSHDGSASYFEMSLKADGSVWAAGQWTEWFRVFDSNVVMAVDESTLYICPGIGASPYTFTEEYGALGDGTSIGTYNRPSPVRLLGVTPTSINVALQNSASVTATWSAAAGASLYRLYINDKMNMTGCKTVGQFSTVSHAFNPKETWVGGINWSQYEMTKGSALYVGVEPYDEFGVGAGEITWSLPITYVEDDTVAPSTFTVIGWNERRNELIHWGEDNVRVYVGDWVDGSYPITNFALAREDGERITWSVDDMLSDSAGKYVVLSFKGWDTPNESVRFELQTHDSAGHAVYNASGSWTVVAVKFYGGTMSVYGKGEWLGDDRAYLNDGDAELWRRGLAHVYDGSRWRTAAAVYVYTGTGWAAL